MTTNRRKLREAAVQVLYMLEFHSMSARTALRDQKTLFLEGVEEQEYLKTLVEGVAAARDEIDGVIRQFSTNWRLERMAVVDRNILRMATYELLHVPDVPRKVCINEAIEVAKRFGGDDSPSFINGILDRIAVEVRGPEEEEEGEAAKTSSVEAVQDDTEFVEPSEGEDP